MYKGDLGNTKIDDLSENLRLLIILKEIKNKQGKAAKGKFEKPGARADIVATTIVIEI